MVPIIGIIGRSGAGKTVLVTRLIKELTGRGLKVAAIKHSTHSVSIDQPGKDSALMREAGAVAVALASPGQVAAHMPIPEPWLPDEIAARLFPDVDLVLVEGFSQAPLPKIGVLRKGEAEDLPDRKGLIAVVSDLGPWPGLTSFSPDQIPELSDLIQTYVHKRRARRDVTLHVNDRKVFIKPFIKDFFARTIAAMVASLKGTGDAARIQILIDRPQGEAPEDEEPAAASSSPGAQA